MRAMVGLAMLAVTCFGIKARGGAPEEPAEIVGNWFYFMKIYKGQEDPQKPDDTLRLHYDLTADGKSRLYWWHEGERDRCERRGSYKMEGDLLVDQTEWVNPENTPDCAKDPDMQPDKLTKTPVSFKDGNLVTRIPLGEEELFYVWKRLEE